MTDSTYKAAIFDLDGTLLDTIRDLAASMNWALASLGRPTHDEIEPFKYFIGDGVRNFALRALGEGEEHLADEVVRRLKQHYSEHYNVYTEPFAGAIDMLKTLHSKGLKLAVLSNKVDPFTKTMVAEMLGEVSFERVYGARDDVPLKPDPAAALQIAGELNVSPAQAIYVGDTGTDMLTGSRAGMFTVGVLWGYRTKEELLDNGADAVIETPDELVRLVDEDSPKA
jgi:phosphoglycolate phosphatase